MKENELKKTNVIKKLINKEITNKEAMVELQKSRQQIYRLAKLYKAFGESCFIHKNHGKTPSNKIVYTTIE